jgi:glutamate racemase
MDERPIGVFDSGIGGLTVVARIRSTLPGEDLIYFGDTARLPYGSKSRETVTRFSREIAHFLLRRRVKAIVVACNSASALALDVLSREAPVPVVGVIEPGAEAALAQTRRGRIGVIGTRATIRSDAYRRALTARRGDIEVTQVATPLFVHLVEEGWVEGDVPDRVARHYLDELARGDVDTVILGCTHYPLLAEVVGRALGEGVALVDSAEETAREVATLLEKQGLRADPSRLGRLECHASDVTEGFPALAERFLGHPLDEVHAVEQSDLPWYER